MARRCPTATVVGSAMIQDYELVFRGSMSGYYASIEKCEGAVVPVLVWDIRKSDEYALDRYEGYPNFYKKEMMNVNVNGKDFNAMVYALPSHHEIGEPSWNYINTILQGYDDAGFDYKILIDALDKNMQNIEQEYEEFNWKMGGF